MLIGGLWVFVDEAARRKNVSPQAVRKALRDGRLLGFKRGGLWLVSIRSLEAWEPVGHRPRKRPAG